ncbi:4-hydroxybenzoate polyprenyltransferase [Clostridium acetobutylicum]|uniref:4-hydroxybenzoate octaprenyltranferase related protein n=1 Tax=Clostridium acetobutylicum (strain ATCC 824 / DSM 792 / JCM 1419 / IAM 19013 / LMG 5710 / NBRC 13948 / NRRL B-527 / VKM B-1787 / 2291 / W) TaxID=272562 RepID=Q97KW6_CLOAB|nr:MULTISPECIES: UbiA family prenyltransferase [Clostridium]AAK78776.1 4-hydroxybenzoate octaprenyltranferase related protein [Clostridium acetobutylicum ATCC 824]ADZ19850.1 prenyltransferase [Clostridium acetobutylicum EA 2018]AEI31446.1 prenyltransferase [Clostridium acetobutylicum DSM 1731]AWV80494.1 prenyltransferase [Clostridium acetobutylicum]MBC2392684.1 UbiA family prenyltransferase [Clostridium acetobutylicum]
MIKRLNVYLKEMYPLLPRLILSLTLFFEIYMITLLSNHISSFRIGIQEFVGVFTVFGFWLALRIADELKDYETDKINFPKRPLPSGRVTKRDLWILLTIDYALMIFLNLVFMNNVLFFIVLLIYGVLMSLWFFAKKYIQPNLVLALITHNPVELILDYYIISFACIKYKLPVFTGTTLLICVTLYFPALAWEVSRKIKAPDDENQYVTYSKLFGYKKATMFVMLVIFCEMITTNILAYRLSIIMVIILTVRYFWLVYNCIEFIKSPKKFKLGKRVEVYLYITALLVLIMEILNLFVM